MSAKTAISEKSLLQWALSWIGERLPRTWVLEGDLEPEAGDAILRLQGGNAFATVIVETKSSLLPRQAENLLPGFGRALKSMMPGAALLVLAPWLSERTREILAAQGINYLDMSGNALIRLDNPALYIEAAGAARNPEPQQGRAQVRGPRAARLIRVLAEVSPPYRVGQLAEATGLAPGYVSRLLDALDAEALIERTPRGPVESVDVPRLLRRWARDYDVFESNRALPFAAPRGIEWVLDALADRQPDDLRVAVTGSAAAVRLAPITAPAMLLAYCDRPGDLAGELGLWPAAEGANVALLEPFDPIVWWNTRRELDLDFVAPSQIAVDCLTGNGRMPSEGEAILAWMVGDEGWHRPSLPAPEEIER